MKNILTIATDGSCSPNPGPGGWAWVDQNGNYECGSFAHGTNNIGELEAIRQALEAHPDRDVEIQYDSAYAVNCITVWGPQWRRRGILHTKKNADLIEALMKILDQRAYAGRVTVWTKVKGHSGHHLNEVVDHIVNKMPARRDNTRTKGVIDLATLVIEGEPTAPRPTSYH